MALTGGYSAFLRGTLGRAVPGQRGVVLIAVLWICSLIMWFALQISAETRLQGEDRILSIRKSQALYLSIGGCYEALARMGQGPPLRGDAALDQNWQPDGIPRVVEFQTGRALVIIEAEDRKINVNRAGQPQLRQALERAGADEVTAERLSDMILDFIDQDDMQRPQGAEKDYYKRAGLNYQPFNGPLTSLDQLLLIPGVTHQLFYGYDRETDKMLDLPPAYKEFLIPGKQSLFSLLTIYGNNTNLPRTDEAEEELLPVNWKPGGVYRILSFGISRNGPPAAGMWLTVRFSPQEQKSYTVLGRKTL
ncbi:MAG: hypothetical protein ABFD97_03095 [Syntrophobacter sp.]